MSDTQEAPDDIRSAIGAAFESTQAQPEAPADPPAAPAPEAAEEPQGRSRDERGRFAAKAEPEVPEEPVEAPAEPVADKKPEAAPKPDEEFTKATSVWSAKDREMAAKLPQEAKDFLVRRHKEMDADYTRKTQEIASYRREWDQVAQMFAPHTAALQQRGLTPASVIQGWHSAERMLMAGGEQAAEMIARVIDGYKVDKGMVARRLGLPTSTQSPAEPADPQNTTNAPVATLPREVEQRLAAMQAWIANETHSREREAATRVMTDIEQFAAATDANGNLQHPHFREVEDDMARLAVLSRSAGRPPVLKDLYEQAVWSNPTTRERMLTEQRAALEAQHAAEEQKRAEAARAKAEQAKRAASSVTGTPGPGQAARRNAESLRDQLEAAFEERDAA